VEVPGELVNDFRSPSLLPLPGENLPSDLPIEQNEFPVHRHRGPDLRRADLALHMSKKLLVAIRAGNRICHVDRYLAGRTATCRACAKENGSKWIHITVEHWLLRAGSLFFTMLTAPLPVPVIFVTRAT
jgi:hypothetical protein